MFRSLRTKLTVLYAGLFGAVLIVLALSVQIAVSANAASAVRKELEANGQVFDRIWDLRAHQLQDSADLLARDYGFRAAASTRDEATIRSALDNLRRRLGIERAFIMDNNGAVIGLDAPLSAEAAADIWRVLDSHDRAAGVLMLGGAPYQAVSAPIQAPDTIGWVVFAAKLDQVQMRTFERMAAIPLQAQVFTRDAHGTWTVPNMRDSPSDRGALSAFIAQEIGGHAQAVPHELHTSGGQAIALVRPLTAMSGESAQTALLLRYPLALALAPYQGLMALIAVLGAVGVALFAYGSWALARNLTRPIMALDEAAQRLQRGEEASVSVQSSDEIGRLADNFNTMASHIRDREDRIRHLALHDLETDLPNRRALEDFIQQRITESGAPARAAVAVAIERFHHVRGAIGYGLASQLVQELGERLALKFPASNVGRLSADMLGLFVEASDVKGVADLVRTMRPTLEAPVRIDGVAMDVSVTFGVGVWAEGVSAGSLLNQASIAVDQARGLHRKIARFNAATYGDPASNLSLMSQIFDGVARGDVSLYHQPKYDIRQQRVTGVEALMRWRHPQRGMISPDLFIPMAEETGHIHALTKWVLRQAISDQARMRDAGLDYTVSVNVSGRLVGDPGFAEEALAMVTGAGASICFEITETAVIANPDMALKIIDRCAEAGIGISIDDYGSGLSSLAYLKQIHANELKIDKVFILSAADSQRDALLVKSTIDLAHGLGLKVTAEGVETPAVLALLAGMGCDQAQGYLIGRPMTLDALITASAEPLKSPLPPLTLQASR